MTQKTKRKSLRESRSKTDLIRALLKKYPAASPAEIQSLMRAKHRVEVSRQSVQYARRVPVPKVPGRPRKQVKCPKCGYEFDSRQ